MFQYEVDLVNEGIARTGKVVIALGCSFVKGAGAYNDELYEQYDYTVEQLAINPQIRNMTAQQAIEILNKYPTVKVSPHKNQLDYYLMEQQNAFVSVLCNKYLNNEYTPINFGLTGCGNMGSISELYFHPSINWEKIRDIVVIYVPSGLERYDFINDGWVDGVARFTCMWPNPSDVSGGPRKKLWEAYKYGLWSDRFQVLEQLKFAQSLVTWCKLKTAKLIVAPGFDTRYNYTYFRESLSNVVERDAEQMKVRERPLQNPLDLAQIDGLVSLFPWRNFLPNFSTFINVALEDGENLPPNDYFKFLGSGSPKKWVTPCCHPSAKAHDLFAKKLAAEFNNLDYYNV